MRERLPRRPRLRPVARREFPQGAVNFHRARRGFLARSIKKACDDLLNALPVAQPVTPPREDNKAEDKSNAKGDKVPLEEQERQKSGMSKEFINTLKSWQIINI